ncbi:copper resistance protein CopC [Cnuibacter sp. UC19_7]|uniref:copper resistance CopC family protein n=1 Tax=Cnuibacter sp. UC19_7 TaxID=3350166 RepID=UPI0036735AD2
MSLRLRVLASAVAGALLAGAAAVGVAAPASAHDYLVSTSPAADSTVSDALTSVSLTFNEPPFADAGAAIGIRVSDPSGQVVSDGRVSITDSTLSTAVAPTTQGAYQVEWQNVSGDGHTVSGTYVFTYAGPVAAPTVDPTAPSTPVPSSVPTVTPDPAFVVPSATATSGSDAQTTGGFPPVLVGLITAGGLLVLAAVFTVVLLVGRRSRGNPSAGPSTRVPPRDSTDE